MPHVNRLFNIELQNVSSNGYVNFGNAILKGLSADSKASGGQSFFGDRFVSPLRSDGTINIEFDPDSTDQSQKQA